MAAPVQIFVSYSHRDSSIVREDVAWLESESLSLFIDDRIDPGTAWPDELADALSACSVVLFFASDAS
ncbi:MAG: toll/interleukin-1 receptor domain-containing protein, partial [Pseudomonadota bacterium]